MIGSREYQPLRSGGALVSRWRNPIALAALLLAAAMLTAWMMWPAAAQSQNNGLTVSSSSISVSEGESATFTVSLSGTPTGDVEVSISSSDTSAVKPAFSSALFTADHKGPYTIPVLGLADRDTTNESATITLTASGGGISSTATVSVSVTDAGTKTLNRPTFLLRKTTPRMAPGSLEGDLNWTANSVKECNIDKYEIHYKKRSVSSWASVSDTADADSGVHIVNLDSQHHGSDMLWVWVKLGTGSQPSLDNVSYEVKVRVDGSDCTAPSAFSSLDRETPMAKVTVNNPSPTDTPTPEPATPEPTDEPQGVDFDGQTLAVKHVTTQSTACLDVSYGVAADGQDVWTWDCNDTDAQKWKFEKRTSGDYKDSYRLVSQAGDGTYCLDNRGDFSTSDRMGIWSCVGDSHWAAANQSVTVAASGEGYTITFTNGSNSVWLVTDRASDNVYGGANQATVSGTAGANATWRIASD